jgi:hypothetical protein
LTRGPTWWIVVGMSHRRTGHTLAEARERLRALGLTITRDTAGSGPTGSGEYRVAPRVGPGVTRERAEDMAYYTADLVDAVATGTKMARGA